MKRITALMVSVLATLSICVPNASSAEITRSLIDRPDDVSGYQIHLVYVVPNGSTDFSVDTNGQIDAWVKEGNTWLNEKVGHNFQFDTFQGMTDVTFMSSKYQVSDLCYDSCDTLSKLKDEYVTQNPTFDDSKTLLFELSENLDPKTCGWASYVSNLALSHDFGNASGGCNWLTSKAKTGLSGPAKTIVHELVHTFGIDHLCIDTSDLMIGTPECTIDDNTFGQLPLTLDSKRNQYIGSDLASGIDLLQMPIWADGSGLNSYATIKQISDKHYVPQLQDDTVYAIIGEQSGKFDWAWEKKFYPDGFGVKCQFTSGIISIVGKLSKSACVFDVPASLRAGKSFTVSQNWVEGPWHGEASITGVLVRKDFSSNPCTENTCFAGGTTTADFSCWESDVKSMTLQQLINGKWIDFKTAQTITGSGCTQDAKHTNYPNMILDFNQTGTYIYRWFIPVHPGFSSYTGKPFAVVVNDENSAEPTQDEIASAQIKAIELGRAADTLKASLKTNITCIRGKLIKKIAGNNPKCPIGYKKR